MENYDNFFDTSASSPEGGMGSGDRDIIFVDYNCMQVKIYAENDESLEHAKKAVLVKLGQSVLSLTYCLTMMFQFL